MSTPGYVCRVEHGFDYVGNDLTSVPGYYDECCYKCVNTVDCKAWSWTNQNGGTCFLKWGRGEIVYDANVKSASVFQGSPGGCYVRNDVDYVGSDLSRVGAPSVDNCCAICVKTAAYRFYTWTDYQGGSCWLKSKVTQTVAKPGDRSGDAYPGSNAGCNAIDVNINYEGNDIANKPSASHDGCCGLCGSTSGCRAYSWSNYQNGTCWLKSQKGKAVPKDGVTSSQLYVNPAPPQCALEANVDYIGNDIDNTTALVPSQCCFKCRDYNGCKAWSWSNYQGGRCWFKSQKGATTSKLNVYSGGVSIYSPVSHPRCGDKQSRTFYESYRASSKQERKKPEQANEDADPESVHFLFRSNSKSITSHYCRHRSCMRY